MAETAGEIKPYDPTLRERLAAGLQAGLEKMGTDRYKARQRAQTVMGGPSSNLPMGLGLTDVAASVSAPAALAASPLYASEGVRDIKEAGESVKRGDYVGAGVDLAFGAMNVAPFVSGVTNLARRALRRPMQPMEVPDIPLLPENLPKRQKRHPRGLSEPEAEAERIRAVERVKSLLGEQRMAGGGAMKPLKEKVKKAAREVIEVLSPEESKANLQKMLAESQIKNRLYHGTMATEGGEGQEAIRRIKPSKEGSLGSGAYLTPNPGFAGEYAGELGGNILPVYAQIKNPLIIQGNGDPMIEALVKLGMDENKAARMVERAYENKGYIGKEVETRARSAGFDGLMQYRNGNLAEVVVYNPNAIKSAIGNRGTYDTTQIDLSKARGGLALAHRR